MNDSDIFTEHGAEVVGKLLGFLILFLPGIVPVLILAWLMVTS